MIAYIIIFITLYITFSVLEWIIHKYIMHNENNIIGKNHLIHHKSTYHDMTLNKYKQHYNDLSVSENLCFDKEMILASIFFYILYFYTLTRFTSKISHLVFSFIIFIILLLFMFVTWNSIHPYIHHEDGKQKCNLAFSYETIKKLHKENFLVKLLIDNHIMHHKRKGDRKGNYCVTLMGADHLFGTYYVKE